MNKYRNITTLVEGHVVPSKKEACRYQELRLLQHARVIRDLTLQPKFSLDVNGFHIANYLADFSYVDTSTGQLVVEDTKSAATRTPVCLLKKKLLRALYGITILEV